MNNTLCLVIVSISVILSGCMTMPKVDWNNPAETSSRVRIEKDSFKKTINFTGPDISQSFNDSLFIRACKNTDGTAYRVS